MTQIKELQQRFNNKEIDYKSFHEGLCLLVKTEIDFMGLSDEEQEMIVLNGAQPKEIVLLDPIERQKDFYERASRGITLSRYRRLVTWCYEKSFIYRDTPDFDKQLWLDGEPYERKYQDADLPHMHCFMNSEKDEKWNIDFTETGFKSKAYFNQEVLDLYNDIVIKGNYSVK